MKSLFFEKKQIVSLAVDMNAFDFNVILSDKSNSDNNSISSSDNLKTGKKSKDSAVIYPKSHGKAY